MLSPKLFSLCRLAVVCGLSALVPIDANLFGNTRGGEAAIGPPTDDGSDILLEEVVTESGDVVGFYEPEPGLILVKTSSTSKRLNGKNPRTRSLALSKRSGRSGRMGKADVAALYERLTGMQPGGRVAEALSRVNDDENEDTTGGRDLWSEPPDVEDSHESDSSRPQDRRLKKSKLGKFSDKDFKEGYCLIESGSYCRTKMKNNYSFNTNGYYYTVFYQAVYTDDGSVRHTQYYRGCSTCSRLSLGSVWIPEGYVNWVIWESTLPARFEGKVDYVNGKDEFHVANYAA
ncbi:hypothetical protein ACHAXS_011888 [Conticribra weissflogii]